MMYINPKKLETRLLQQIVSRPSSVYSMMSFAQFKDDIRQSNFTNQPCLWNANCKCYRGQIPKAAKMKRIPLWKQHQGTWGLRKFLANEAWWWILSVWRVHALDSIPAKKTVPLFRPGSFIISLKFLCFASSILRRRKFEKRRFALKTHQMFSFHTTPEKSENFGFAFEEDHMIIVTP